MRPITILTALLLTISLAHAKPKRFMRCLGQEEAMIHKKNIGGPLYKLNQEMIGSLVQLRDSIYMKKANVDLVCGAPYPSIKLLELLLTQDEVFFSIYTQELSPKNLAVDESTMRELKHNSAFLFVGFIAQIQAGLSKPDCLEKHVPGLAKFLKDMQYIQENVGVERIIKTMDKPGAIFKRLQTINFKKIKC